MANQTLLPHWPRKLSNSAK